MKLYIENGEVLFDFSDIDTKAKLDIKVSRYRQFLRDTRCNWEYTDKHNVMRMVYEPFVWATEYGNLRQYESLLKSCYYKAKALEYIEVLPTVEELLETTAVRCKKLYDEGVAKEQKLKAAQQWEEVCTYGCGHCSHKQRWNDDCICSVSGDVLSEKPQPGVYRGVYQLFNYVAFPTENCPLNVEREDQKAKQSS